MAPRKKAVFGEPLVKTKLYHLCGRGFEVTRGPASFGFGDRTLNQPSARCPQCGTLLAGATLLTEAEVLARFGPPTVPSYQTPLAAALHAMVLGEYRTHRQDGYHLCGQRFKLDLAFDTRPARFVPGWNQTLADLTRCDCPRCQRPITINNITPVAVIKARFAHAETEPLSKAVKRWQAWRRRGVYAPPKLKWYERMPGVNFDTATQRQTV